MDDKIENALTIVGGVLLVIVGIIAVIFTCKGIAGVFHWLGQEGKKEWVCVDKVKVIDTKQYYDDNGKYEDEAYQVTYEDGSKAIIDDPSLVKSGYYCRKEVYKQP